MPAALAAWAALTIAAASVITVTLGALVPLLVLAAAFEGVFALHLNVERIGRYLQVFHEPGEGWEHVAMTFGERFPSAGSDPLFARLVIFFVRRAQSTAAAIRAEDLRKFESIRSQSPSSLDPGPSTDGERQTEYRHRRGSVRRVAVTVNRSIASSGLRWRREPPRWLWIGHPTCWCGDSTRAD